MHPWLRVVLGMSLALHFAPRAPALELEPITAERPWLVFRAPVGESTDALAYADQIHAAWDLLDVSLRPLAAVELPGPRTGEAGWGEKFGDVVNELQVDGIQSVVSITNSPRSLLPIEDLRSIFDRFTSVSGVHVRGLRFDIYPAIASDDPSATPAQVQWLVSAIELAANYGRRVLVELDGLQWIHLSANTWNEPLIEAMRRHPAVVVPMNGQHGPHATVASSTLMGLWIEGTAAQWGVSCDPAWFTDCAFVEPGVFGVGAGGTMPPAFYRAMILNGAMTGATVYRFPMPADLWTGLQRLAWHEAIAPSLSEITGRGYIARKDFVLDKLKLAYRLNPATSVAEFDQNLADLDPIFHEGRMLHGAYGLELPGQVPELVLNSGTFYWVPILSPWVGDETLQRFKEVETPGALLDAREWRDRLSSYYAPDGDGTAFISRVGRAYFIMHSRENFYEEQPFALAAVPAPVRGASASRTPDGVAVTWPFREGDVFYRVYRRVLPSTQWEQVSPDLDVLTFTDIATPDAAETTAYAVTALTNEMEPYEGTVNYGDYLIVNTVESRIVEEIVFETDTQAASSLPVPPKVDGRPASQQWWPDYGDIEGERLLIAQSIVAQIESFEVAYRARDAAGVIAAYDPEYATPDGWGIEYVRAAWDLFVKLHRTGPMHRQIRAWDFSQLATAERVVLRMYCKLVAQPLDAPDAESPAAPIVFPAAPDGEVTFTFHRSGDRWLIADTNPPLPRMDDWFPPLAAR
jgi:hypothetical protein